MQVEYVKLYKRQNYRNINVYKCYCGLLFTVREDSIKSSLTRSCGCLRINNASNLWRIRNDK